MMAAISSAVTPTPIPFAAAYTADDERCTSMYSGAAFSRQPRMRYALGLGVDADARRS